MHCRNGLSVFLVVMVVCIASAGAVLHDGVLKYDAGDSGTVTGTYGMNPWGHAVLFKNPSALVVTGIQVYGCKFGTGTKKIFIEIWDKDLKRLYRDPVVLNDIPVGQMDVSQNNCGAVASWADIPLPDHAVTGDFYVVVFTYSPRASATTQGMSIGLTYPSSTASSHTVTGDPNRIDEVTILRQYDPTDIDWMIRTYYTKPVATPAGTPASTPVPDLTQQNTRTVTTTAPALIASPTATQSAVPSVKAESTQADPGTALAVAGLLIGLLIWKRPEK